MRNKVAVLGLGSFGSTVARELMNLHCEVLGVDIDEALVERHADLLTHAVEADASTERVIEDLGLASYDAVVVAIGEQLEASILATLMLKQAGVARVWVRATNHNHHRILERLGADHISHPEHDSGIRVAQQLLHADLVDFMAFGGGLYVVEVTAPERLCGETLSEIDLGEGVRLIAARRGTEVVVDGEPGMERVIEGGDRFLLVGRTEALQALQDVAGRS